MLYDPDTIAALATPQGVGGLHIIRLSGPQAIAIADEIFRGALLQKQPSHTLHYGNIVMGDTVLDEVVMGLYRAPKSYTMEDVVEISCHGSPYIAQRILTLLTQQGARIARPGEFTLRAFMNGRLDLSQAEAVADLIAAENDASHTLAIKQLRGGFAADIQSLRQELIDFAALIELELDFIEEDVEFADRGALIALVERIRTILSHLIQSFRLGNVMKNGVPTVIAGRPNAGKSTLLNALLNEERAIVSEIPGTTRDAIEEVLHIEGLAFRFIDTAGIREATDAIESIGVEKTLSKLKQAGVVIYLFDSAAMTPAEVEEDIHTYLHDDIPFLLVANKADLSHLPWPKRIADHEIITISAEHKQHLDSLKTALKNTILYTHIPGDQTIVSNVRHHTALLQADLALERVLGGIHGHLSGEWVALDIRTALEKLGEISGEVYDEDLLDSIFSRFCIGK